MPWRVLAPDTVVVPVMRSFPSAIRRSGAGGDGDGHAESLELAHEPAGLLGGGSAAVIPVRSQVLIGDAVSDDVVLGDEDVVAGRADRFLGAAATAVRVRAHV